MQRARHRRAVAPVTALVTTLVLVVSGALVMVSGAPAAAVPAGSPSGVAAQASATAVQKPPRDRRTAAQKAAARKAAAKKAAARKAAAERVAARKVAARKAVAKRAAVKKAAARRAWLKMSPAQKRVFLRRQAVARKAAALRRQRAAAYAARLARVDPRDPRTWIKWAPGHVPPRTGVLFNNPYGSHAAQRVLVNHVIATIRAAPGYQLPLDRGTGKPKPCPTDPALFPSTIKIALYSIADQRFASALIAAHRRCVSVQLLMNSHLTAVTSPAYGRILAVLGQRGSDFRTKRSFARRCTNGCLGTSVLHSKFFLFSKAGAARDTVITGSSNMTTNAIKVQWNDLFTVTDDSAMYKQYLYQFNRMTPDVSAKGPFVFPAVGRYQTTFLPFKGVTRKTDPTLRDLRTIRCVGARGTAGIKGRTVLYIAMHAWFEDRGDALARQVRAMVRNGCYVRVLYSFMSHSTYRELTKDKSRRLVVRRVLFPGPFGDRAGKYSHIKMFAASGNVAGNPRAHVVWTGSTNWTGDGYYNADELTLRISSPTYYRAYVRHWFEIKRHRSSRHWAKYLEPEGGGRAP